jgi:hypothetical protein
MLMRSTNHASQGLAVIPISREERVRLTTADRRILGGDSQTSSSVKKFMGITAFEMSEPIFETAPPRTSSE